MHTILVLLVSFTIGLLRRVEAMLRYLIRPGHRYEGLLTRSKADERRSKTARQAYGLTPWHMINANQWVRDADTRFWWTTVGYPLSVMLEKAGYTIESQYRNLLFYLNYVAPELGVCPCNPGRPSCWRSFMTDDHTPVELSWSWGIGNEPIVVRFSIEPIGPYAGTSMDPLNNSATHHLVRQFQAILPDLDLRWYDHFSTELLTHAFSRQKVSESQTSEESSSTFVAFDLEDHSLVLKAYFIPGLRAAATGQTCHAVVAQAIRALPSQDFAAINHSFSLLFDFILRSERRWRISVEILAIDCIEPVRSRLKVYFRSQSTSFDSVREVMTLGGTMSGSGLQQGLQELEDLWQLLLWSKHRYSSSIELQARQHRTAGILYYFEIRPGHAEPTPKVYIPVRHYGYGDLDTANNLRTVLSRRRQTVDIDNYMRMLQVAFPSSTVRHHSGSQTYIGCTIKDGRLNVISYFNPQVYSNAQAHGFLG